MNAWFLVIFPSSSNHLSGLKVSGSGKYFSSLNAVRMLSIIMLSFGMVYPPNFESALEACQSDRGTMENRKPLC